MKNGPPDANRRDDQATESPVISFAHLNGNLYTDDTQRPATRDFGFPDPQEEALYRTGVLIRIFLKC